VQSFLPDRFFTAEQQQRLADLLKRRRTAREQGGSLTAEEHAELEALVEAELKASADRAAAFLHGPNVD